MRPFRWNHTDYGRISKRHKVPVSTVRAIIWEWKEHNFTLNGHNKGIPARFQMKRKKWKELSRELSKVQGPRSTTERPGISRYSCLKTTISNPLNLHGLYARLPCGTTLLNKRLVKASLMFPWTSTETHYSQCLLIYVVLLAYPTV